MADREVIHEYSDRTASALVWLAVVLSIVALILAWIAYNRTGEDLEAKIQEQVNSAQQSVENQIDTETPNQ
jgi:sensor domain CHASE-containing protein